MRVCLRISAIRQILHANLDLVLASLIHHEAVVMSSLLTRAWHTSSL